MMKLSIGVAAALALGSLVNTASAAVVCRLDPYGDNFLSLRAGPGGGFPEIARLDPDTGLSVYGGQGPWLRVRTQDGAEGWVFRRYVCGR